MSLSSDLKDLKRQRREELKSLHLTYLRTKRDVQRAASPGRIVRKHLGVGLGVAALAGFLLAPKPAPRVQYVRESAEKAEETAEKTAKKSGNWLTSLFKSLGPKLAAYFPGTDGKSAEHHAPPHKGGGALAGLLKGLVPLLTLLLKKVNVQRIVDQVMEQVVGAREKADAQNAPDVSVADVGTVKPTDFDNFN
jgi:hypothetical protein